MKINWYRLGYKEVLIEKENAAYGWDEPRHGPVAKFARWRLTKQRFDWSGWEDMGYVDETDGV